MDASNIVILKIHWLNSVCPTNWKTHSTKSRYKNDKKMYCFQIVLPVEAPYVGGLLVVSLVFPDD